MRDLLKRPWSQQRDEWLHVLFRELPGLTEEVVEVLRRRIPGFSALLAENHKEGVQCELEQALLTALSDMGPAGRGDDENAFTATAAESTPASLSRDCARRELLRVLTGEVPVSDEALAALSQRAGWPLPARVQAVVLAAPGEPALPVETFGDHVTDAVDGQQRVLLADPGPDTRAALLAGLRGRAAAVGHAVPLGDAASSMRWARRLLALAPALATPCQDTQPQPAFVEDHLTALVLMEDESLVRALSARRLGPLEELTERQRERLEGTLLAWLEGGGVPEAAKALKVHPQTVHYRLRQLEKLFGPTLRDPLARFELEMTLHGRRLAARVRDMRSRAARRGRSPMGLRRLGLAREARVNGH